MVKKRYFPDVLNSYKAQNVIESLKESCSLCKQNADHTCCMQPLIKLWKEKKSELDDKTKNYY